MIYDKYVDGQEVWVECGPIACWAKIRGMATADMPVIGPLWIVEFSSKRDRPTGYKFSCIAIPDINIHLACPEDVV